MTLDDVDAVMHLEKAVYQFPWTDRIFKDCIRVGYDCWLALFENTVVAHAVISVSAGESHILNLSVTENHQGKGIGKQFLQFLLNIARNSVRK